MLIFFMENELLEYPVNIKSVVSKTRLETICNLSVLNIFFFAILNPNVK